MDVDACCFTHHFIRFLYPISIAYLRLELIFTLTIDVRYEHKEFLREKWEIRMEFVSMTCNRISKVE